MNSSALLLAHLLLISLAFSASEDDHFYYTAFLNCIAQRFPALSANATGFVHPRGSASYAELRRSSCWNLRRETAASVSRPAFIVAPSDDSGVQASVVCCRELGLHLRVVSGGHDFEGLSTLSLYVDQGFVVVDIRYLRSVSVDVGAGTAWAQAGATIGELYYAIAQKSSDTYSFPAGNCPTVGLGGYLSGGGIGQLMRKHGLAADNVIDAQIVDAYGTILDKDSMGEDLFWAIRGGGGGSYGIVVAWKLKLVPVPATVAVFSITRTRKQGAVALVHQWQSVAPVITDDLYLRAGLIAKKNMALEAMFVALYLRRCDSLIEVMDEHFPQLGVRRDDCQEMTWVRSAVFFADLDAGGGGAGRPTEILLDRAKSAYSQKAKSDFVQYPIPLAVWEDIWSRLSSMSSSRTVVKVELTPFGGRMAAMADDSTPFPHRKAVLYNVRYGLGWFDAAEEEAAEKRVEWVRGLHEFLTPFVTAAPRRAYVNYRDVDLGWNEEGRSTGYEAARSAWGEKYFAGNFRRLAAVKATADPDNFFWHEQSVPPLSEMFDAQNLPSI